MSLRKIISREYKLVLQPQNFWGNEKDLLQNADAFWRFCKQTIEPVISKTSGRLDTIDNRRQIRFYDTANFMLNKNGYIFRQRQSHDETENEVTLKFRHPDRFIAMDRNMNAGKNRDAETKFEEDIKAPFVSLYSFSATQAVKQNKELKSLQQLIKLYPGLEKELPENKPDTEIFSVHKNVMQEIVITGASINIGTDEAECALIVWYEGEAFTADPAIVEFSFRYGNKKGQFGREAAQNAYSLFLLIQQEMKPWINTGKATKTGFVYGN